jgi:hypothetical protein
LPTPGTTVSAETSPATTARRSESGASADRNASATLGPMPFTVISRSNSPRSSGPANPNSCIASSRTCIRVKTRASRPTPGSLAIVETGASTS